MPAATLEPAAPHGAGLAQAPRLDSIDGLRALAMTMVIAQHCGLLPFGWTGVWLFFALSGYVITRGLLAEERGPGAALPAWPRYTAFLRRRVLRIVPAYALYLVVCASLFAATHGRSGLQDLAGLLSFTYNWQMIFQAGDGAVHWPAIGHLWTLSVEQQFYAVFPLLFLGLPERLRWRVAGVLVLLAPLVRLLWLQAVQAALPQADAGTLAFSVYASTVCQADAFLLGALLARYQTTLLQASRLPLRLCISALLAAVACAAVFVAANHGRGDSGVALFKNIYSGIVYGQGRELVVYSAINALAAASLLATLAGLRGTAWLATPWLAWVGRVSYGGYLVHALILWALSAWLGGELKTLPLLPRLAGLVVVLALTLLAAGLSFHWIEQPIARRWRHWAGHSGATVHLRTARP